MRTHPSRLLAAAGLVSVLALSGCGSEAAGGGDSDDKLLIYAGRDEGLVAPLIEQFEQDSEVGS